jgi:ribosome-binding factor A
VRRAGRHRPERLATLIQETLAEALTAQLKDPRVGFITVTSASVTPDGAHATVRVSVLGSEDDKTRALATLEHARGFLRSHLAKRLALRVTPELHFELDRGIEHAQRIDRILEELRRGSGDS